LDISGAGGERAVPDLKHGFGVGSASPDEIDGSGVVVFVDDPGRRRAAVGRIESGAEVVGTAEEADDGAGLRGVSGTLKGFGGRGAGAGVGVTAGGGSIESAVGRGGGIVDGHIHQRAGGGIAARISDFCGKSMSAIGEGVGVEAEGPTGSAGSIGEGTTIDRYLDGTDG